jgi:uncharacterized membrane protein
MHIARQTPQELVFVSGTRWVSAICAAAAVITFYFAITRHKHDALFLAAFCALFAVIMDLRKTFTFDAMQRTVRWSGRKVFKFESGEIPFDHITDIGTETRRAGRWNSRVYRLTIITPQSTIPMAYAYSGQHDGFSDLRRQILDFLKSH